MSNAAGAGAASAAGADAAAAGGGDGQEDVIRDHQQDIGVVALAHAPVPLPPDEEAERLRIENNIREELLSANSQLRCGELILENGKIQFTCSICNHQGIYQSYQSLSNHLTQKHHSIFNFFGWPEGSTIDNPNYGPDYNYSDNLDDYDSDDSEEIILEIPIEENVLRIQRLSKKSLQRNASSDSSSSSRSGSSLSGSDIQLQIKLYHCRNCIGIFGNLSGLIAHKRKEHNDQIRNYKCLICKKVLRNYWSYLYHKRHHSKPETHACQFCKNTIINKKNKRQQEDDIEKPTESLNNNNNNNNTDTVANTKNNLENESGNAENLMKPKRIHCSGIQYKCSICSETFNTINIIKCHMLNSHQNIQDNYFHCKSCKLIFESRSELTKHNVSHITMKMHPFKCCNCDAIFYSKSALLCHKRRYSTAKPKMDADTIFTVAVAAAEADEYCDSDNCEECCKSRECKKSMIDSK